MPNQAELRSHRSALLLLVYHAAATAGDCAIPPALILWFPVWQVQISAFDEGQKAVIRTTAIDEVHKALQPLVVRLDQQSKDLEVRRTSRICACIHYAASASWPNYSINCGSINCSHTTADTCTASAAAGS